MVNTAHGVFEMMHVFRSRGHHISCTRSIEPFFMMSCNANNGNYSTKSQIKVVRCWAQQRERETCRFQLFLFNSNQNSSAS